MELVRTEDPYPDEESSNVYIYIGGTFSRRSRIDINHRMTVGVGFKHVLNNMSAISYMGTIMQPETRMIASLSVGYFF